MTAMVTRLPLVILFACLAASGGCAQRTITVTSEPAGALVHLNDEEVGRTPLTVPFTFYGVYDVRLQADGYKTLWTEKEAVAPLWEAPGPDLIAEALGAKVNLEWHFDLEPVGEINEDAMIDRAKQLRATVHQDAAAE